jgi:hypothetical protein
MAATPREISVWIDDPGSGQAPIRVAAPVLRGQSVLPLAFGKAPADGPRGSAGFRFWTAAEALRRGAALWASVLPKGTRWWLKKALPVKLDAGDDLNAYYDRSSLSFFHSEVDGRVLYSGESPDVVCHELGHAVLDAVRPELWDAMSDEVAAFHEAFGDVSAVLSALQLEAVRKALLAASPRLYRASFVSRLAEELGWGIRQSHPDAVDADCLRSAVNSFAYRSPETLPASGPASLLSSEPHSLSRVFTAEFFEAVSNMLASRGAKPSEPDLAQCSRDAAALIAAAAAAAPIVPEYFSQVAAHAIEADARLFKGRYRDALQSAFVRRGILSVRGAVASASGRRTPRTARAKRRLTPVVVPELGLGETPVLLQLPDEGKRFAVRGAAPSFGEAPGRSSDDAARQFLTALFRRGRVALADDRARALPAVRHAFARKTHEIRGATGGNLVLSRRCFDCGL